MYDNRMLPGTREREEESYNLAEIPSFTVYCIYPLAKTTAFY